MFLTVVVVLLALAVAAAFALRSSLRRTPGRPPVSGAAVPEPVPRAAVAETAFAVGDRLVFTGRELVVCGRSRRVTELGSVPTYAVEGSGELTVQAGRIWLWEACEVPGEDPAAGLSLDDIAYTVREHGTVDAGDGIGRPYWLLQGSGAGMLRIEDGPVGRVASLGMRLPEGAFRILRKGERDA